MFPWSSEESHQKLLRASDDGDAATVRALLKEATAGFQQACSELQTTPLHAASADGDLQAVEALLAAHANANAVDGAGRIPLHGACNWSDLRVVEVLLRANANPNTADMTGKTPLHEACLHRNSTVAQALLVAGADLHAKEHEGLEPLHLCISSMGGTRISSATLETRQVLVSFGAVWDATCDKLATTTDCPSLEEAHALRLCMALWAQERVDGQEFTIVPIEVVLRGAECTQVYIDSFTEAVGGRV